MNPLVTTAHLFKKSWYIAFALVFFALLAQTVMAQGAPQTLHYQGRLLDQNGDLLGGSGTDYCFRFSFYSDETVGAPDTQIWPNGSPGDMTASVRNGVFTVGIGDISAGGDTLDYDFNGTTTPYLNIEVADQVGGSCGGGDETYETLSPRQPILSTSYSLSSGSVFGTNQSAVGTTTVADAQFTVEATSTNAVSVAIRRLTGQVGKLLDVITEAGASLFTILSNGNVGIGTTTPYATLAVSGNAVFDGYTTTSYFVGTSTATSTLAGGLQTAALDVTATAASSTFANGIEIATGCLSIGGTCIDSQAASTYTALTDTPGAHIANAIQFSNGTLLQQNESLTFDGNTFTTSAVVATSTLNVTGLSTLTAGYVAQASSTVVGNFTVDGNSTTTGYLYIGGIGTSTFADDLHVIDTLQVGNGSLYFTDNQINASAALNLSAANTNDIAATVSGGGLFAVNGSALVVDSSTGYVGIGTSSPYSSFSVAGDIVASHIFATTTATSTFSGGVVIDYLDVSTTTASSTFANGINVQAGCFAVSGNCIDPNAASSYTALTDTPGAHVVNSIQFSDGTNITQNESLTFDGNTFTTAGIVATNTLAVTNLATLGGGYVAQASSTVVGDFTVTGNTSLQNVTLNEATSTVLAVTNVASTSELVVSRTASVGDTLLVTNLATLDGGFISGASSTVIGDFTTTGNFVVEGTSDFTALLTAQAGAILQASSTVVGNFTVTGLLNVLGTGTSTIAGGLNVDVLNVSSTTATSTFANGITLGGGCYQDQNGNCLEVSDPVIAKYILTDGTGSNISAATATSVPFNSTIREDSGITASTTEASAIHLDTAGWYRVDYQLSATNDGTSQRTNVLCEVRQNDTVIPGSQSYSYSRTTADNDFTNEGGTLFQTTAVDEYIQIFCIANGNVSGSTLINNTPQITIEKIGGRLGVPSGSTYTSLPDTPGGLAAGTIQFVNALGTAITQAASFIFDGTNLGVGTTSPYEVVSVGGNLAASGIFKSDSTIATSTFANGIEVNGGCVLWNGNCLSSADSFLDLSDTPGSFAANAIPYTNSGASQLNFNSDFVFDGTRLGIGTSSPYAALSVVGEAVAAYFTATSTTATSTFQGVSVSGLLEVLSNASSTFQNGIELSSGCFRGADGSCLTNSVSYLGLTDTPGSFIADAIIFTNDAGDGLTQSSGFVYDPTTGRLGVNEAAPEGILDISTTNQKDIFVESATGSPLGTDFTFRKSRTGGSVLSGDAIASLDFYARDPSSWNQAAAIDVITEGTIGPGQTPTYIAFSTDNTSGSYGERVRITQDGRLGIGTSSPYELLSVEGDIAAASVNTYSTAANTFAGILNVTATNATSTFSGGLSSTGLLTSNGLQISGGQLLLTTSASSSFANGVNLTAGCFSVDGICVGGVSDYLSLSDTPSTFTNNAIPYTDGSGTQLLHSATFVYDGTNVGIGTSSPYAPLSVNGDAAAASFTASGVNATSSLFNTEIRGLLYVSSTTATTTFANGIAIENGCISIGGNCLTNEAADYFSITIDVDGNASSTNFNIFDEDGYVGYATTSNGRNNIDIDDPTGRITINKAGTYFINLNAVVSHSVNDTIDFEVHVNGSPIYDHPYYLHSAVVGAERTIGILQDLSTSDYIEFYIDSNSGNATILDGTSATIYRLGPTGGDVTTYLSLSDTPGVLTANTIPFVNGAGNALLHQSDFVFDGTNLGVGTDTPAATLAVDGGGYFNGAITVTSCTGCSGSGFWSKSGSEVYLTTESDFVGVGTSSPYAKLSVVGDIVTDTIFATSTTASSTFAWGVTANALRATEYLDVAGSGQSVIAGSLNVGNALQTVDFDVTGSATSTFAAGLQVDALRVNGSTGSSTFANGIEIENGCYRQADGTCIISSSGTINSGTTNRLVYYSGATTLDSADYLGLDVTNSRLGIGTSTPQGVFATYSNTNADIYFESATNDAVGADMRIRKSRNGGIVTTGDELGALEFYGFDSQVFVHSAGIEVVTEGSIGLGQVPAGIRFSTSDLSGNFAERIRITPTGNLGIGTTSPYGKLSVVGDVIASHFIGTTTATSTFGGGIELTDLLQTSHLEITATNASSTFANGINVTSGCFAYSGTCLVDADEFTDLTDTPASLNANRIIFTDGAGTSLTDDANFVFSGSNLGIGTSTPYAKLSVAGEVVAALFTATNTNATSTFAGGLTVGGNALVYDLASGFVGIGTSTPGQSFAVAGNALFGGTGTSTYVGNLDVFDHARVNSLQINSAVSGAGLTDCNASTTKLAWDASTGQFECHNDQGAESAVHAYDNTGLIDLTVAQQVLNLDATTTQGTAFDVSFTSDEVTFNEDGMYLLIGTLSIGNNQNTGGVPRSRVEFKFQASTSVAGFVDVPGAECESYSREENVIDETTAGCTVSFVNEYSAGDRVRATHQKYLTTGLETQPGSSGITIVKLTDEVGADYAEVYYAKDLTITSGDIVAVDPTNPVGVTRSTSEYQQDVIGIVSTEPGMLIGNNASFEDRRGVAVALTGRVPMKVNSEGGVIEPGDRVTASTVTGVGMKAVKPGQVIGIAMEAFTEEDAAADLELGGTTQIMVFVNPHWYGGDPERFAEWFDLESMVFDATEDPTELHGVRKVVYTVLKSLGATLEWGALTVSELFADKIVVHNADVRSAVIETLEVNDLSVNESLQMTDATTGEIFCMVLEGGNLVPKVGVCGGSGSSNDQLTTEEAIRLRILGNNPARIDIGSTYADLGAVIESIPDKNLGIHTFVNGVELSHVSIDTSTSSTHTIEYVVTRQDGTEGRVSRTVIVGTPEITEETATPNLVEQTDDNVPTETTPIDTTPEEEVIVETEEIAEETEINTDEPLLTEEKSPEENQEVVVDSTLEVAQGNSPTEELEEEVALTEPESSVELPEEVAVEQTSATDA